MRGIVDVGAGGDTGTEVPGRSGAGATAWRKESREVARGGDAAEGALGGWGWQQNHARCRGPQPWRQAKDG